MSLYAKWQEIQAGIRPAPRCLIGFDGFTDTIVRPVAKRVSSEEYVPFATIADFGKRIEQAAGVSCNIELVTQQKKAGGNAPIMTTALIPGGHAITFAGTIGEPGAIEPLFQDMAKGCARVIPLGPSAHSDALEFTDGKILLGKLDSLSSARLTQIDFLPILESTDLFACVNWTMLPMMNDLWAHLLKDVVPRLSQRNRFLFVDLADPAKRSDEDLKSALDLLIAWNEHFHVILSLNHAEAMRVLHVLGGSSLKDIQTKSELFLILVHSPKHAVAITQDAFFSKDSFYCDNPKITTGAGDNFNAGFCTALLYGLEIEECLRTGVATAGYYVRNAASPSIPELVAFLQSL